MISIYRKLNATNLIRRFHRFFGDIECSADPLFEDLSLVGHIKVVEIGTRFGDTLVQMSRKFNVDEFIAVDPYIDYEEYDGEDFSALLKRDSKSFERITKRIKKHTKGQVTFLREFSDSAHTRIENEWADFIFIDGNHEYSYVLSDLENYWPKVKPGGFLTGHDYWHRSIENGGDFPRSMVYEAVEAFGKKYNLTYSTHGVHGNFPACFSFQKTQL